MTNGGASILIVDDESKDRKLLEALLRPEGYQTRSAANGEDALAAIAQSAPDLILLDIMMPGMDGYEVASRLKANPATANIPIVMVTANIDHDARLAGLNAGAEEFLTKPVDRTELWLRVRNLLRLKALNDFLQNHSLLLEDQVQARTADLERLTLYDPLTGLPNRALFFETLKKTVARAHDHGWSVAVLLVDVDRFKNVNDTLGPAFGDGLLAQLTSRLLGCVRVRDTVGRLGSDEFAMILVMEDGEQGAAIVANKILAAVREPFNLNGHEVAVTVSLGIALHPDDASDPETLIKYADTAMYQAKQAGRDTFRFFTAQMNTDVVVRLELETALRKALENDEFVLHYQPKVGLATGGIVGVEALLRWQRPGHGLVSPKDFIPVLEQTGLIVDVGRWVIATACKQVALWMQSSVGPVPVSVNVSGQQFVEGDLEGDVIEAIEDNSISADLIELELTESSLMADTERTIATLEGLKRRGVMISIDDFGTGYSSMAYLTRFPIDKLKIDIAFIREITNKADDAVVALAIIRLAHGLKLEVIAEGVETAAQLAYLQHHGCDQVQGYYFSPPLPVREVEQLLCEGTPSPKTNVEAHAAQTRVAGRHPLASRT